MPLAELCTRALCRSLPDLDGFLPPGLPQECVDDIIDSLVRHSALNSTTLRALKNCELRSLSLAGCRGVNDEWLESLCSTVPATSNAPNLSMSSHLTIQHGLAEPMDVDAPNTTEKTANSIVEETSSFMSASSHPFGESGPDVAFTPPSEYASAGQQQHREYRKWEDLGGKEYNDYSSMSSEHHEEEQDISRFTSNLTLLDLRGSQRLTDKGLLQLSGLSNVQVAQLDNCYSIVGRGLLAFSNSFCLHTLSLANCRRLTDEAIINISHILSLQTLSLVGCRCITDRSLAAIAGLTRLKKLDMSQCDLITDAGLEEIRDLALLEELSLGWCHLTDMGVDRIVHQSGRSLNLRSLCLARIPITNDGVEKLAILKALTELDLSGCSNIGSAVLGTTLEQLTRLKSLDVSYCPGIL